MKRPLTSGEFFTIINNKLKQAGLLPDILDYSLADSKNTPLKSYHWDPIGIVNFGGSEGIYLDVYASGNVTQEGAPERVHLGTYKTLESRKPAFQVMSNLNTEFVFTAIDFLNEYMDMFEWTGWSIQYYAPEGIRSFLVFNEDQMKAEVERLMKKSPIIIVTDRATKKTKTYR